ncbi:MAG: alginate lyase family protein [Anaerolineaceae bacterium]
MSSVNHLLLTLVAGRELGFEQTSLKILYRLGLKSGYFRKVTPARSIGLPEKLPARFFLPTPAREALMGLLGESVQAVVGEADELFVDRVRLFGGSPVPLRLEPGRDLRHWTAYENHQVGWGVEDVKFLWEPARFGWAFLLGRAYCLTGSEAYAQLFWQRTERFLEANPVNLGPNWTSGQEVALRLVALTFAFQVFSDSAQTTLERKRRLIQAVADHAARIPPTLIYARSQNNNHLVSEAIGLYTAGVLLPDFPEAVRWRELGWRWLNHALQSQITGDGAYCQHSTNYHRLMLQAALWADLLCRQSGETFPRQTVEKLAAATRWLLALLDPVSGQVPNLGHNDGSYILSLATGDYADYRPVLQAASRAFLGQSCLAPGAWDELSLWLGLESPQPAAVRPESSVASHQPPDNGSGASNNPQSEILNQQSTIRNPQSWAYLRAAHFTSRPGHADQLHVDMWWQGQNIALDAGTFQYNAAPPWENSLAGTSVHNTITVDSRDQMQRAGRFLWVNWAQAFFLTGEAPNNLAAQHYGYKHLGILHCRRLLQIDPLRWHIKDDLLPTRPGQNVHCFTLHWLLPDWPWEMEGSKISLSGPNGKITLVVTLSGDSRQVKMTGVQLVRGGKAISGSPECPLVLGWYSPTYGQKVPALSLRCFFEGKAPISIISDWLLSPGKS